MFEKSRAVEYRNENVTIRGVTGGEGHALLLLHGYPQTHHMWHRVFDALAKDFTVVASDLRGYGASDKPDGGEGHANYSKRAMANDQVGLMSHLGHARFFVLAHDRGARVAHRMAIDHEEAVRGLMLLDIAPTREMYRETSVDFAHAYWHWFFLTRPTPGPERMIAADARAFWLEKWNSGPNSKTIFDPIALSEYLAAFEDPKMIHASCEDYRAAATIDIEHDNADKGRKLTQPLHVLWAKDGVIEDCFDCLSLWRERASNVTGRSVPSGHFIAEEVPDILISEVQSFFGPLRQSE